MNNKYTDKELIKKQIDFIERTEQIMNMIDNKENENCIREEYKKLKECIKDEAHRVRLQVNQRQASKFEQMYYAPSIREANAWGFDVKSNARVSRDMWRAVEEAHYKLSKYISLEELKDNYMKHI